MIARGLPETPRMPKQLNIPIAANSGGSPDRDVYFGPNQGWATVPIVERSSLSKDVIKGPAIVEEYDSTTIIPSRAKIGENDTINLPKIFYCREIIYKKGQT